jgi:hypothetical protein
MAYDTPSLLFHQAAEFLVSARVTRPGVVTLMEMAATTRTGAGALTSERVGHLLTEQVRGDLDRLLVAQSAVEATSAAVKTANEKLLFLRGLDALPGPVDAAEIVDRIFLPLVQARGPGQARRSQRAGSLG